MGLGSPSFHWRVEAGVPYWRQNKRSRPSTFPHDFADYGLETGDSALGYWLTERLISRSRCLFERRSLMTFGLALNLDRHLSRFQVKVTLGLILQLKPQNSPVDFYPFWGMPRCHCRKLARLDLNSYPQRMKVSRQYLNC